jgi:chromosome segregation ATPase
MKNTRRAPRRIGSPARCVTWAGAIALGVAALLHAASAAAAPFIYSCTLDGKRITRDRYIAECSHLEQRVLNPDGSLHHVEPPTRTMEEQDRINEQKQLDEQKRHQRREAERRDRALLHDFPNQAAHDRARARQLDEVRGKLRVSEARLARLVADRKPLLDEAEFYVGKPFPDKLKRGLDQNDALLAAQKEVIENQRDEIARINERFDVALARLRQLWAGAAPGSLASAPASRQDLRPKDK